MSRGDVLVLNTSAEFLHPVPQKFEAMGATITTGHNWIRAVMTTRPKAVDIRTRHTSRISNRYAGTVDGGVLFGRRYKHDY